LQRRRPRSGDRGRGTNPREAARGEPVGSRPHAGAGRYATRRNRMGDGALHTRDYLRAIGVPELPPATSPFDPGYDPVTLEAHLEQSAHLISILKISMACWLVADEAASRRKFAAARRLGVPTTTGGGPFEVAVAQGRLDAYLDLVADMGAIRVECGEGFTEMTLAADDVVR